MSKIINSFSTSEDFWLEAKKHFSLAQQINTEKEEIGAMCLCYKFYEEFKSSIYWENEEKFFLS